MFAREYELIYIVRPDSPDEDLQKISDRTCKVITDASGTILDVDVWGKRKLAYEIEKFNKGHYTRVLFLTEPEVVAEVERTMRLDDTILRFLTVRLAERVDVDTRIAEYEQYKAEMASRVVESDEDDDFGDGDDLD